MANLWGGRLKIVRKPNTIQKTEQVVKKFSLWLLSENRMEETDSIENLPPEVLDHHLSSYLLNARKTNGDEYEPDTLTSIHRAIERYLHDVGYGESILSSPKFATSRSVLATRRRELRGLGLGKRPNKGGALTREIVERLWEAGELGTDNGRNLQNTMFFYLTQGFKFGALETRELLWGDVTLQTPVDGTLEYLEYNGRLPRTRQGTPVEEGEIIPKGPQMIYATGTKRCPVEIYKIYESHRPESMKLPDSPFYLGIKPKKYIDAKLHKVNARYQGDYIWYASHGLGINTLTSLMGTMAKNAGIQGSFRNSSVRMFDF